jgi:hypothetical protein
LKCFRGDRQEPEHGKVGKGSWINVGDGVVDNAADKNQPRATKNDQEDQEEAQTCGKAL